MGYKGGVVLPDIQCKQDKLKYIWATCRSLILIAFGIPS